MIYVLNWLTVLITSFPLCRSIKKVLRGKFGILHLLTVIFWLMQVFPLAVDSIFGIDESIERYRIMYDAMTDFTVGWIYCLFTVFVVFFLYFTANKSLKKERNLNLLKLKSEIFNRVLPKALRIILFIGMFAPCFAVLFAPDPGIYFEFSYFYMNDYSSIDLARLYHLSIMYYANYIALGCTLLQYLYRRSGRLLDNIDVLLAIIILTWVDGKRAMLTFALLGVLVIDVLRKRYSGKPRKLILKAIIFAAIILLYFIIYGEVTGKNDVSVFLSDYVMYYSRHSCVKVAIYDRLNSGSMLEYAGQSILYNLFFFIPRSIWPDKPVLFCKYFTPYAIGYKNGFLQWNLHVNLWTEFIANFGILGVIVSFICIKYIAQQAEKSRSILVYLSATCFLVFYFMFGFEILTQIIYLVWIGTTIWTRMRKLVFLKQG